MKQLQLGAGCIAWLERHHLAWQTALLKFTHKGAVAVWTEGVSVAKTVAGQPLPEYHSDLRACGVQALRSEPLEACDMQALEDSTPQ
jgi:hypothetical protein